MWTKVYHIIVIAVTKSNLVILAVNSRSTLPHCGGGGKSRFVPRCALTLPLRFSHIHWSYHISYAFRNKISNHFSKTFSAWTFCNRKYTLWWSSQWPGWIFLPLELTVQKLYYTAEVLFNTPMVVEVPARPFADVSTFTNSFTLQNILRYKNTE